MEKRFVLSGDDPQLWTREKAREKRGALTPLLDASEPGDTIVIDAGGVEVFDYSFANEFFGKTILSLSQYPGRFVIVENLTSYTRENLIKALESMNLCMIERKGERPGLIGKVHPTDEKTFAAIVRARGPVTAAELATKLKVNLNAMNERLSKLAGLGLVRREKGESPAGREQYNYTVLQ